MMGKLSVFASHVYGLHALMQAIVTLSVPELQRALRFLTISHVRNE